VPAEADNGEPAGRCFGQPKLSGTSGPDGLGLPKQVEALPAAVGEGGVNRRPTSQAEVARISTEVETELEDRVLGLDEAPIRRSGPPHHRGGPELREVRGDPAEAGPSLPFRAPEFVAPFRGTRFQVPGSDALRGSGRLRGLAPLTSPLRLNTVASAAPLVSPMGLFPLRGPLSPAAVPRSSRRRSARKSVGRPQSRSPWSVPGIPPCRSPVRSRIGPLPHREWRGGTAASLRGLLATPRPGIAPRPGFAAPPPKSVRERESRAAFRRVPLVASGSSSGPSRWPP